MLKIRDFNSTVPIKLIKSIFVNLIKIRTFLQSVNKLHEIVEKEKPDIVINFYDFLAGLYFLIKRPKAKHVAIAHQMFLEHSQFTFPKGRPYDSTSLKIGNQFAAFGATKKLALSFKEYGDEEKKKIFVVPPLLRDEIKEQSPTQESHFLVYMVNSGYAEQVRKFHAKHPDIPIHCFWDKKGEPEILQETENLTFHQLNDKKFISMMASCRGYLTTAGFESVCEAMYLGKPVLMVPVSGHYEQKCNAKDAENAGAGISSEIFDLESLLSYLPEYESVQEKFNSWCDQTESKFLTNLTDVN